MRRFRRDAPQARGYRYETDDGLGSARGPRVGFGALAETFFLFNHECTRIDTNETRWTADYADDPDWGAHSPRVLVVASRDDGLV